MHVVEKRDRLLGKPRRRLESNIKTGVHGIKFGNEGLFGFEYGAIEEEIPYRTTLGNKAYYAKQFFFKIRLVSKKSKLKLYWSVTRPIVTYACEAWVLKETIKNKLMVFERKVLSRIFGPTKERDCTWKIKETMN